MSRDSEYRERLRIVGECLARAQGTAAEQGVAVADDRLAPLRDKIRDCLADVYSMDRAVSPFGGPPENSAARAQADWAQRVKDSE